MRSKDRFRGCLVGGAAGDALGYAVEFVSEGWIFAKYGPLGITQYELSNGKAIISDDTQMTLFTAAGLLGARDGAYTEGIRQGSLDWYRTQTRTFGARGDEKSTWLMDVEELFYRRAPGITCLDALHGGGVGTVEKPINNSKGCGGVMRIAPIGLFFNDAGRDADFVARLGAEAAAMTHGHPLGYIPSAAFAQMVHEISQNGLCIADAAYKSLETAERMWKKTRHITDFIRLIEKALKLAGCDIKDLDAIHKLGEGWVADEALAIAVYCAAKYPDDIDRVLIASVNHKGDSDSTGAIAGNLAGAYVGYAAIPPKYTQNLELIDTLIRMADEMYEAQTSNRPA